MWVLLANYFDTLKVWTDSIFGLLKGMCQMELGCYENSFDKQVNHVTLLSPSVTLE